MEINKRLIDYLLSNSGRVPDGETWYSIGIMFGVEAPDADRAKTDEHYRKSNVARKAQKIWQQYLSKKNKLELAKEIYENGQLKWETFKKPTEPLFNEIDSDKYDIERITTNPHGGAWFKLKRKEGFLNEEHFDKIKEILSADVIPLDINPVQTTSNRGLFIYGADKHIGALTKDNSIYKNLYDKTEIQERLVVKILKAIKNMVKTFGVFDSLFIMDLGDALDGFNQKTTGGLRGTSSHTLPQQLNNREQHDVYLEVHKLLFDNLVDKGFANNLYFIATSNSNHGGDFEYTAMRHLQTYLELKYPFINTHVSHYPLNHFIYGDHCIIFGHGKDDEDMKAGLPLNLTDKVENFLNDYIRKNKLGKYNISFVSGDLHQSSENYGKIFRYKKVLSQFGSTKWMHTNFGSGSPGVSIEIFEKDKKRIFKVDEFFEIENESNTGINLEK